MKLTQLPKQKWIKSIVEVSQALQDRTGRIFCYRGIVVDWTETRACVEVITENVFAPKKKWLNPSKLEVVQHGG